MKKKTITLEDAKAAIRKIAEENHISVEEVRAEMTQAMEAGMNNSDPEIQAKWKTIPCKGSKPTPEEVIIWASKHL